ncbi:MAG: hypothetical protein JSR17_06760 [Proteobacteria bacterium]|nr:hypothetical protein [Pseudomonadota bacterium]
MKTGSLMLTKELLKTVGGGVSPNYPAPNPYANIPPAFLFGNGGSNLHSAPQYQYQFVVNVPVNDNFHIGASIMGTEIAPMAAGIGFTIGLP